MITELTRIKDKEFIDSCDQQYPSDFINDR